MSEQTKTARLLYRYYLKKYGKQKAVGKVNFLNKCKK